MLFLSLLNIMKVLILWFFVLGFWYILLVINLISDEVNIVGVLCVCIEFYWVSFGIC